MHSKISEKTDGYLDRLHMGLEVWEKQLILGAELEAWATAKLSLFAESHPFSSDKEVFQMKVWKSMCCCVPTEIVYSNALLIIYNVILCFNL